jgi:hypothetical protein
MLPGESEYKAKAVIKMLPPVGLFGIYLPALPFADVAQLVEQLIRNQQVNGSTPFVGSSPCSG